MIVLTIIVGSPIYAHYSHLSCARLTGWAHAYSMSLFVTKSPHTTPEEVYEELPPSCQSQLKSQTLPKDIIQYPQPQLEVGRQKHKDLPSRNPRALIHAQEFHLTHTMGTKLEYEHGSQDPDHMSIVSLAQC